MGVFSPEKRSEVMSRIRGHDTKPELALRSMLHRLGYRFTVKGPHATVPCPVNPISSCPNTAPSSSSTAAFGTAIRTVPHSASHSTSGAHPGGPAGEPRPSSPAG